MNPIRKILLKYKAWGLFDTADELAEILETSRRRAGYILSGEANLSSDELITLQKYFGGMRKVDLSYLSIPEGYGLTPRGEVRANGSTLDEMRDMIRELHEVEDHKLKDVDEALKDVDQMREILDRYETELKAMKS